jgi:hypothetical protein
MLGMLLQNVYQVRVASMVGQMLLMKALYRIRSYLQVLPFIRRNGLRLRIVLLRANAVGPVFIANARQTLVPVGVGLGQRDIFISGPDLREKINATSIIPNVRPGINLSVVMAITTVTASRTPRIKTLPPRSLN